MFDIGWTEMLVIAIVMIVVVGPKDLPKMLRTFGRTTTKLRSMAGDFRKQFDEALKEAELDDVKKSVDSLRSLNPTNEIRKHLNPFEKAAADVRAGLDAALKPPPMPRTASTAVHTAEPLKNGATAMPEFPGPVTMPPPPIMTATPPAAEAAASAPPAAPVANGKAAPKARATKPKAAGPAAKDATANAAAAPAAAKPKPAAKKVAAKAKSGTPS